jgi:hypothetical protein
MATHFLPEWKEAGMRQTKGVRVGVTPEERHSNVQGCELL